MPYFWGEKSINLINGLSLHYLYIYVFIYLMSELHKKRYHSFKKYGDLKHYLEEIPMFSEPYSNVLTTKIVVKTLERA